MTVIPPSPVILRNVGHLAAVVAGGNKAFQTRLSQGIAKHELLHARWDRGGLSCHLLVCLSPTLTNQFFPAVDRNRFKFKFPAQPGVDMGNRDSVFVRQYSAVIPTLPIRFGPLGRCPRVYYNVVSLNERVPSFAAGGSIPPGRRHRSAEDPAGRFVLALPRPRCSPPFEQGPPTNAPIELRIIGPDLAVLRSAARLRAIVAHTRNHLCRHPINSSPSCLCSPENTAAASPECTGHRRILTRFSADRMPARYWRVTDKFPARGSPTATATTWRIHPTHTGRDGIPLEESRWQLQQRHRH